MRVAVAALSILVPALAAATVMIPLSIEDMTKEARLVVRARVRAQHAAWSESKQHIFTFTELEVLETLRGTARLGEALVVRTLGGEVGDVGMAVAGSPKFAIEEELVLFLRTDPVRADDFQVVGMSQGRFEIRRDAGTVWAVPSLEGVAFATPKGGKLVVDREHAPAGRLPLDELRRRVKAAEATPGVLFE